MEAIQALRNKSRYLELDHDFYNEAVPISVCDRTEVQYKPVIIENAISESSFGWSVQYRI